MEVRGQRFVVDLSDDEDTTTVPLSRGVTPFDFVSDIVERPTTTAKPPTAPKFKSTTTGFPEHKKRGKVSAFKQQRASNTQAAGSHASASGPAFPASSQDTAIYSLAQKAQKDTSSFEDAERKQIDDENRQRLDAMTEEEIEQERQELFSGLNQSLIERLLRRGNIEDGRGDTGLYPEDEMKTLDANERVNPEKAEPNDAPVPIPIPTGKPIKASKTVTFADDEEPTEPMNFRPISEGAKRGPEPLLQSEESLPQPDESLPQQSVHFPTSASIPDLDPSDPDFLSNLHSKYFPDLPADPSKLAWMAPLPTPYSPADLDSPYSPAQVTISPSALRFSFRGTLLPPRISRAIPTSKGLHHHGEAPEAAGYTIPELSRLARSAFPAQRCMAFQMLGRILYRLGKGEWTGGNGGGEIMQGLWRCIEEGKVIEGLEEAASVEGGHMGSKAYALEAIWLYKKGGGKVWKTT